MSSKKLVKGMLAFCLAMTLVLLAAACSSQQEAEKQDAGKAFKSEPVTLKIMVPGDRPADLDEVLQEAEKRMADTINVKLDLVFVPWSDLGQKTQVTLSSGEDIDLIFDAPWLHMNQMIAGGYYEPLDNLLKEYGSTIMDTRPEAMWEANKFEGKVYGIPLGAYQLQGKGYLVRKDLREKAGLPPIKTYEDLVNYMYKVKESENGIIPFTPQWLNPVFHKLKFDYETQIKDTELFTGIPYFTLYFQNNDGKVHNMFEEKSEVYWNAVKEARKLYEDGIIHPDIMAVKSDKDLFKGGKTAVIPINDFGVPTDIDTALKQNIPGAEAEFVTFFDDSKKMISNFKQYNFISLSVNSKNKEKAIQFLDWANKKENYDLLAYGIEGKHWEAVGENMYKSLNTNYTWFPYVWIWNPVNDRLDATQPEEINKWNQWAKEADNFEKDVLTGFNFNSEPVANEIAQLNAGQNLIEFGAVEPEKAWEDYKAKSEPLIKKIQEEMQKQIDEFLKTKQ
jgi:putative aldouronate transport system substrate-binding protein